LGVNSVAEAPVGARTSRRAALVLAGQAALLAAALAAAVLGTEPGDWTPWSLFFALLALAAVGQFLSIPAAGIQIGPAFIATALAMALLGPAPAAAVAVGAVLVWTVKARTPATG
jgi:hypothetical protein